MNANKTCNFVFVHNYGFTAASTNAFISRVEALRLHACNHPEESSLVLMGDFNLTPTGSVVISLADAASISNSFVHEPVRAFESKWNVFFAKLVEIDFPLPSHVNSASLNLSRINRYF